MIGHRSEDSAVDRPQIQFSWETLPSEMTGQIWNNKILLKMNQDSRIRADSVEINALMGLSVGKESVLDDHQRRSCHIYNTLLPLAQITPIYPQPV